jgi:Fe-S-cluster-containing dehydrogenase component/formate-dependent nitrite reductase membrane component NrfD
MPRLGFAIDNRVCIGCHACTVACKAEHDVPLGVNRTWVKYIEKGQFPDTRRSFNVQRCNHCDDAPCVEICPVTALYKRPDGVVDFDNSRCIGCKACMQACPYDALYLDPNTDTAAKCNYCTHRLEVGLEPACVVVCPVEAIVSGDLDDPGSRIARLEATQRVQYPKPEKGTRPKLFYVGGETAALDPLAAPPVENYLWSGNDGRISLPQLRRADQEANEHTARRTYDPPTKPVPWGWIVSAYITTKALATGIAIVAFLLYGLGFASRVLPTSALLAAMLFLSITGALLVADLKQPRRFLYVLLRPQWKSWLVRGAYLITVYSLLLPATWMLGFFDAGRGVQLVAGGVSAVLAGFVAIYTALLFAQAKGRDYWQNSILSLSMLFDSLVAGVACAVLLGLMNVGTGEPARFWLSVGVIVLALVALAEYLPAHPNRAAAAAARHILRGSLAGWFWGGVVSIGLLLPAALLASGTGVHVAALALLAGIAAKNHVLVQAPQRVPLA